MRAYEITDTITQEGKKAVWEGLVEYNLSKFEEKNPKDLGIYHRVDGKIMAGLIGQTHGNWLEVDYLWVAEELWHRGIGSDLLRAAEEEAVRRNCRFSFLNTFGFQAPDFYVSHGYREVLVLEEIPLSGTRHYYLKNLG